MKRNFIVDTFLTPQGLVSMVLTLGAVVLCVYLHIHANTLVDDAYRRRVDRALQTIASALANQGQDDPTGTAAAIESELQKDPNNIQVGLVPLPASQYMYNLSLVTSKRMCPEIWDEFHSLKLPPQLALMAISPAGDSACAQLPGDTVMISMQWAPTGVQPHSDGLIRIH